MHKKFRLEFTLKENESLIDTLNNIIGSIEQGNPRGKGYNLSATEWIEDPKPTRLPTKKQPRIYDSEAQPIEQVPNSEAKQILDFIGGIINENSKY